MKNRVIQYILIILTITAIGGSYFYYQSRAAMTINKTGLTSVKLNTAGLTSVKINSSQTGMLTSGLVGFWTMDGNDTTWTSATAGTTADKSPVGTNTGTLTNMSQSTSPAIGKVGQGMYFDGVNDIINIPNSENNSLYENISAISVSLWFKINQLSSAKGEDQYLIYKRHNSSPWSSWLMWLESSDNKLYFSARNNSATGVTETSDSALETGRWYYVAGVYDGSNVTLYVDGIAAASPPSQTGTIYDSDSTVRIGAGTAGASRANGIIDEVRIYNKALSQSEITELYNMGR